MVYMAFIHYYGSPELPTNQREAASFFAEHFRSATGTAVELEPVQEPRETIPVNPVEAYAKKYGMDELLLDPNSIDAYVNLLFKLPKAIRSH